MTPAPDISAVMSVYNGANHLRETCESVLSQKGVNLEFIIVNDGSTDSSGEILRQYARHDSRVSIIENHNQGLTISLIQGCLKARGRYIARQDVGDLSLPDRLRLQKRALDADEDLAFVSSWTEYCGPEWEFLFLVKGRGRAPSPVFIISEKEMHGVIDGPAHHGSVMFRRNAYLKAGGYRPEFYYGQDWDLWYRMAEVGRFQMVEKRLYKVRLVPSNISMRNKGLQESLAVLSLAALRQRLRGLPEEGCLVRAMALRPDGGERSIYQKNASALYFIGECLRRNGDQRAVGYFKQTIRESPLFVKAWLRLLQSKLSST